MVVVTDESDFKGYFHSLLQILKHKFHTDRVKVYRVNLRSQHMNTHRLGFFFQEPRLHTGP